MRSSLPPPPVARDPARRARGEQLRLEGRRRQPSIEILGSYFPAWLICLTFAILLTFLARWLLLRLQIPVVPPILVYPCMTAMFTFALWLVFYG